MMKKDVYLIVIALLVAELFKILIYAISWDFVMSVTTALSFISIQKKL